MQTKIIEATQPNPETNPQNWGKFMLMQFSWEEFQHPSAVESGRILLPAIGYWHYDPALLWVMDLQTGEGALFNTKGSAAYDLNKHKIWVCPLFEPFLEWLYKNFNGDLDALPAYVQVECEFAFSGYRRGQEQQ